jgi:hypothetical protein
LSLTDLVTSIHQNPVGLVKEATDWEWPSARWHAGVREGALPIEDPIEFRVSGGWWGSYSEAARIIRELL